MQKPRDTRPIPITRAESEDASIGLHANGNDNAVTDKALSVIERNLHRDLTLDQIAKYCEVSRFHLARAFGNSTGLPVMEYFTAGG